MLKLTKRGIRSVRMDPYYRKASLIKNLRFKYHIKTPLILKNAKHFTLLENHCHNNTISYLTKD